MRELHVPDADFVGDRVDQVIGIGEAVDQRIGVEGEREGQGGDPSQYWRRLVAKNAVIAASPPRG